MPRVKLFLLINFTYINEQLILPKMTKITIEHPIGALCQAMTCLKPEGSNIVLQGSLKGKSRSRTQV